jgi:hypothetical protein
MKGSIFCKIIPARLAHDSVAVLLAWQCCGTSLTRLSVCSRHKCHLPLRSHCYSFPQSFAVRKGHSRMCRKLHACFWTWEEEDWLIMKCKTIVCMTAPAGSIIHWRIILYTSKLHTQRPEHIFHWRMNLIHERSKYKISYNPLGARTYGARGTIAVWQQWQTRLRPPHTRRRGIQCLSRFSFEMHGLCQWNRWKFLTSNECHH